MNECDNKEHDEERPHPLEPSSQDDAIVVLNGEVSQLGNCRVSRRSGIDDKRSDENHRTEGPAERGENPGLAWGHWTTLSRSRTRNGQARQEYCQRAAELVILSRESIDNDGPQLACQSPNLLILQWVGTISAARTA